MTAASKTHEERPREPPPCDGRTLWLLVRYGAIVSANDGLPPPCTDCALNLPREACISPAHLPPPNASLGTVSERPVSPTTSRVSFHEIRSAPGWQPLSRPGAYRCAVRDESLCRRHTNTLRNIENRSAGSGAALCVFEFPGRRIVLALQPVFQKTGRRISVVFPAKWFQGGVHEQSSPSAWARPRV